MSYGDVGGRVGVRAGQEGGGSLSGSVKPCEFSGEATVKRAVVEASREEYVGARCLKRACDWESGASQDAEGVAKLHAGASGHSVVVERAVVYVLKPATTKKAPTEVGAVPDRTTLTGRLPPGNRPPPPPNFYSKGA